LQNISQILGPVLTVAVVAVVFVGTISASWFGSLAFIKASGMDSARAVSHFSASFTIVAIAFEIPKLALATRLGIGRLRHQIIVLVLWAVCVAYGWLMPVLLLVHVPIWPATGDAVFSVCAVVWAFVQVMSGLLPAVRWSISDELGIVDHPSAPAEEPMSKQPADPAASDAAKRADKPIPNQPSEPERNAAEMQPALLDDDACFAQLREFAFQPGAATGTGIRIGKDHEITGSQRDLALILGLSKATAHRRLHKLANQGRLSLETYDGTTRIGWP
jgi:hypothetical protein